MTGTVKRFSAIALSVFAFFFLLAYNAKADVVILDTPEKYTYRDDGLLYLFVAIFCAIILTIILETFVFHLMHIDGHRVENLLIIVNIISVTTFQVLRLVGKLPVFELEAMVFILDSAVFSILLNRIHQAHKVVVATVLANLVSAVIGSFFATTVLEVIMLVIRAIV